MSLEPASASSADSSSTASSANVVAAMNEIFSATAPCCPTGRPHCTRSADHSRAIFRHHLPAAAHSAGIDSRPVLSVVSAILRPSPSRPSRFSAGTRTWWKRVTPFSMPLRPMNALRLSTVIPGESVSTTNAVMPPRPFWCSGTRAITTTSSAMTPLVVHSFTPSRRYAAPSSVRVAVERHPGRVGADVGLGQQERGDRAGGAAGQEPLLLLLGAEHLHRLRDADRLVGRQQRAEARVHRADQHQRPAVVGHGEPETAVLARDLHAERADLGRACDVLVGDPGLALDPLTVERLADRAQLGQERLAARDVLGGAPRVRVDQREVEAAEVELLGEARLAPPGLAGRLGDLAGLRLGCVHAGARPSRLNSRRLRHRCPLKAIVAGLGIGRLGHVVAHPCSYRLVTTQCYHQVMAKGKRR